MLRCSHYSCKAEIISMNILYALGLIITPSRCHPAAVFICLSVLVAIFVMRVYSISQSYLTARRILVIVAAGSHMLIAALTIIGLVEAIRTHITDEHF